MKVNKILFILTLFLTLSGSTYAFSASSSSEDPGWPRVIKKNGQELTIYQPQVDYWQDYKNIHVRFAIAVKDEKTQKEVFGVAEVDADTVVDQTARVVAVMPKKRELRFPNTSDAEAAALRGVVEKLHPFGQAMTVSLDRVLAYLDPAQQPLQQAVELNIDPPKVFYSSKPAILVLFMGEPQLQPVKKDKNDLMFVANTNWDVFYDTPKQQYYLLNQESWLTTPDVINGPWKPAASLPPGLSSLPADDNWADVRKRVPGKPDKNPPAVFVSKEPAELILTKGEPAYSPIPGTKLLRLTNTEALVFLHSGDGNCYFLTAGRWFRAKSLDGTWSIASNDLPSDFSKIPDDNAAAFVKASVPGTVEAKDAVLLASVPRTTALDVSKPAKLQVTYNGPPNFQAIPSTPVQYAANSSNAVFLVNGSYYCCEGGVWYSSSSANGPWAYSTNVPAAIYTIPPSHPMHNVTYVVVQSSTPTTVVYSQTAGYSGEYVAANGVLMFGAGMVVGALIADNHNHYYPPYPMPYSYGSGARYNYAYGGYYRAAQVSYGPYGGAGAGAAYNPNTGVYSRGAYAYGPAGSASVRQAYNPYTGTRAQGARVDTAYGSAGRAAAYNPYTGTAARGGYRSNDYGTVAGIQTNKGTGAVAWDTQNGQGAVAKGKNGNVYAGKDGNVYKKDSSGNWSSNTGDGWAPVDKPQPKNASQPQTQQRSNAGQTSQAKAQQRSSVNQTSQAKAQPQSNISPSSRAQAQPQSTGNQFSPNKRDLESQAQSRARGNQLSQNRSSSRNQFSQPRRAQGQPRSSGGGGGGRRR